MKRFITATGLAIALATVPAFATGASKTKSARTTFCVKDGVGVEAKGNSTAARKKACTAEGGTWVTKSVTIGMKAETAPTSASGTSGSTAEPAAAPSTDGAAPSGTETAPSTP